MSHNTNSIGGQVSIAAQYLCPKHLAEWCEGSGVPEAIARLALRSLNDRTVIKNCIGWKHYSDTYDLGWFASGLDLATMQPQAFGQFKPDTAIQFPEEDKPTKYISDKGHPYDAIALPHPDKDFWQRVVDDPSHPVKLAEGPKKAGCLMGFGYAALALCGVTMGLKKGGKDLVKNLELLAVQGRPIEIVFDADLATKPDIQRALKALATVLKAKGCVVSVTVIPLELDAKGIDDVWAKHGAEMVKKIMADAVPYSQWLKNLEIQMSGPIAPGDSPAKAQKPPTPRKLAAEIAEQYGNQWKFDNEQKTWRIWNGKCWQKTEIGAFTSLLKTALDAKNIDYAGIEYIENVRKLLECDLRQVRWQTWDRTRYISFNNCVFDGLKGKTLRHSPGMGFTSCLPYDYKPLKGDLSESLEALRLNCPGVHEFFRTAMKADKRKMFKLLAIVNAVLKHRFFDLQMFVHLVGAPGSGKGKFARFCQKLVGKDNTIACQLDKLGDGSTKASVVDKQLVLFPDERKPVGIDSILSLTGGDEISYRELYQRAASAHFYGSLLVCSNKPIFIGDTTGLERRLCLVGFDNPIATEKRDHSLEQQLESEIPACIAIALSLADSAVTQAIQGIGANQIVEYKAKEWEMKVEVNSVAAFFDAALILDPGATTTAGKLYDAYKEFCDAGGLSKFSITKFPRLLADILADENLPATRHQGRIAYFQGLRLRTESDIHPTRSETLAGLGAGLSGTLAGLGAGLEPLPDIHQRDLRDLDTKPSRGSTNNYLPHEGESNLEKDLPPSSPASPSNPLAVRNTSPAQVPHKSRTSPANVGTSHKEFKVGDRVVVAYDGGSSFERAAGKVTAVKGQEVTVEFDEPIKHNDFATFNLADGTVLMKLP